METVKKYLVLAILALAFVFRVVNLASLPNGFTPDEASFGYDAYSILKTGKDQWGNALPLVLKSFGDYKSPLYAYLDIPFVATFGLTPTVVRLPNALLGTLAVLVVYLLVKEVLENDKLALFSALIFAISPWHIMLSRGAFEANLITFFLPLGILLFFKKKYVWSAIIFGLNMFTYHSAKVITPLVFAALFVYQWEEVKKLLAKKQIKFLVSLLVFGLFVALTGYTFLLGAGSRVTERSITQGALEEAFTKREQLAGKSIYKFSRLFYNKYTITASRFVGNYLTYISPQFLFTSGPKEATYGMLPGRGVLYLFTIPFLLFLIKPLNKNGTEKRFILFLVVWIATSIIPAALATGVGYSANRAAGMMPAINILVAIGGFYFFELIANKKPLIVGSIVVMSIFVILFCSDYFIYSKPKTAQAMLYGNLEIGQWVSKNIPADKTVIVDKSLSEPQIYFAFADRTDPKVYQKATEKWDLQAANVSWVDQLEEYGFGRFTFKDIKKTDLVSDSVLIGRPDDFPVDISPSKVISYPNGKPAIYVVNQSEFALAL